MSINIGGIAILTILVSILLFGYRRSAQQQEEQPLPRRVLTWRNIWVAGMAMIVGSLALSAMSFPAPELLCFPGLAALMVSGLMLRRMGNRFNQRVQQP